MFCLFLHVLTCAHRPKSREELFNLRHASARNVIERIFGVLKRRFRILLLAPQYSLKIQAQIPAALCALHNFISIHTPSGEDNDDRDNDDQAGNDGENGVMPDDPDLDATPICNDNEDAKAWRDEIAEAMWVQYQSVLEERAAAEDSDR